MSDPLPKKYPFMKFFPSDWRSDPALRMCSVAARGLWMEMLCLMHEAEPKGSLVVNGRALSESQLAALAGMSPDGLAALMNELETAGVFSRDADRTIFSRRMRRDVEKAARDFANGKSGGNPALMRRVNPRDKSQKPETGDQNPETRTAAAAAARSDLKSLCEDAAGMRNLPRFSSIVALVDEGVDVETRIIPMIRTVAGGLQRAGKSVASWSYFAEAIRDPDREPEAAPAEKTVWVSEGSEFDAVNRAMVDDGRSKKKAMHTNSNGRGNWFPEEVVARATEQRGAVVASAGMHRPRAEPGSAMNKVLQGRRAS